MVALTTWKIDQIEKALKSGNSLEILGIEQRINTVPDPEVLDLIEEQLISGKDQEFSLVNTVAKIGNNLELVDKVTPENSVDIIISGLSLHIVPDPDLMLQQCFEVLKPGGRAAFSV